MTHGRQRHFTITLAPLLVLAVACSPTPEPEAPDQASPATAIDAPATDPALVPGRQFSEEDEAEYLVRFQRLAEGGQTGLGLLMYDPLEAVPGAVEVVPFEPIEPGSGRIETQALRDIEAFAAERNSSALLVWRDGVLELERYFGEYDRDTPIVSRSLAKPLTGIAVGRALKLGYIESLDQPVADFVTEWQGDALREQMLIRHLLDMRTGFLPQGLAFEPEHILNRAYLHPRHDEVIIHDYPLVDPPGTRYEYSNATSEMVAVVIERATGMRYAEFLSQELLEPLGAAGGDVWINRPGGMAHSGCCILLPGQTWLRLALLLLEDGSWDDVRLLPEGFVDEMTRSTPQNERYGLGVYVAGAFIERRGFANPERQAQFGILGVLHSEPYLADDLFLFDGNSNQVVYIVPSERLVILRTGGAPPQDLEWDNSVLPNLAIAGTRREEGETMPTPQRVPGS